MLNFQAVREQELTFAELVAGLAPGDLAELTHADGRHHAGPDRRMRRRRRGLGAR